MSDTGSSDDVFLTIDTPLGAGVLHVESFDGEEAVSQPFRFRVGLLSEDHAIAPSELLYKAVTVTITWGSEQPWKRVFHGMVSVFVRGPMREQNYREYHAEIVPWFWFLLRRATCRIFQDQAVPDIVEAVFQKAGFSDYKLMLNENHPTLDYCVQYRETDFAFVSRLLEQEGIFYYFKHEKGQHTLVLTDNRSGYFDCPEPEREVQYQPLGDFGHIVTRFERIDTFTSGVWVQRDYNFETPDNNLETKQETIIKQPGLAGYEVYDYPGGYMKKADGSNLTRFRMEEEEAAYETYAGDGACSNFIPAAKFTLKGMPVGADDNQTFVLLSVRHSASAASRYAGQGASAQYRNGFTCLMDSVLFRPARRTPKAVVRGPQTAFVVGPSGEEIYCDKYGRVKVQFHWDRVGKDDEHSSCWIRVAQPWAGKNWGAIFIPRIATEVLVDFLEGDPDRPIVTGGLYNANQMPPYGLPDNKTQSGVKTHSSKGGGASDANELRFEDKKGSEEVYVHAQKDYNRLVENDESIKVKHDQTIEITNNRTETVKQGNDSVTIEQGNRKTAVSLGKSELEAMQSIELTVGSNSIKIDQTGITIKGMMVKINGDTMVQAKAPMTEIDGDGMLTLKGGVTMIN